VKFSKSNFFKYDNYLHTIMKRERVKKRQSFIDEWIEAVMCFLGQMSRYPILGRLSLLIFRFRNKALYVSPVSSLSQRCRSRKREFRMCLDSVSTSNSDISGPFQLDCCWGIEQWLRTLLSAFFSRSVIGASLFNPLLVIESASPLQNCTIRTHDF